MAKMLLELPLLTNSLRLPFDADQAYLNRKSFLQTLNSRRYVSISICGCCLDSNNPSYFFRYFYSLKNDLVLC
ncbi:hypothetical protein MIMGU_mgv1a017476mg [Erythranthe guttata]|uniref:Uncharacterized protein n=1 Tax=Erythranthe guttata TaxID=4155 RepID=A0A022RMJ9_ERYGU|nr:hypothetical protein MIMGU_mgv1a017476mg [Erythranthe guttata]